MSASRPTAILVAGMHRSGTSAVTGALSHFGVALGTKLLEPGDDNPKGYWENERAVAIHETLLQGLQRHWSDVRPLPLAWKTSAAARRASDEISALIDEEFSDAPLWAVKDPRICWFLPLWLDVLTERDIRPTVLMAARRPSEVAASIQARNGWQPAVGRLLWLRHVMAAEAASRDVSRTAITYDRLLSDPNAAIGMALSRLDVNVPNTNVDRGLTDFVDADIRNFRHDMTSDVVSDRLANLADTAYEALNAISEDAGDWDSFRDLERAFDEWSAEYGDYVNGLADMAVANELRLHDEKIRSYGLLSDLNAQIAWSEDAVKTHVLVATERDSLNERLKTQEVESSERLKAHAAESFERLKAQEAELLESLKAQEVEWHERLNAHKAEAHEQHKATEAKFSERVQELEAESIERLKIIEERQADIERLRSQIDTVSQLQHEAEHRLAEMKQAQTLMANKLVALESELVSKTRDEAVLSEALSVERGAHQSAKNVIRDLEMERQALCELRDRQAAGIVSLEAALDRMQKSRSWRLTRPLRAIARRMRNDGNRVIDD